MATPRWTCLGYLLFLSHVMIFFSDARVPPPSGLSPNTHFISSSDIMYTVNGDGTIKQDGDVPSFSFHENHVKSQGFGSDRSNGYYRTQPGTSQLACTPVNCPTPSGVCGVIYINLDAQTSTYYGDLNKHHHIAMAPSN